MASLGDVMLRAKFTKQFVDRLPYLDEILFENFDAPSLTYPSAFNVQDSTRAFEEKTGIAGFGQFPEKSEGSAVEYDTLLQGFDVRFTHKTFAKGFQISTEAMDDDIDGAITIKSIFNPCVTSSWVVVAGQSACAPIARRGHLRHLFQTRLVPSQAGKYIPRHPYL